MDASGIARGIVLYTLPAIGLVGGLIGCGLNAFYLNEYLAIAPSLWTSRAFSFFIFKCERFI